MEIISSEENLFEADIWEKINEAACAALKGEDISTENAEISVSIVSSEEIQRLNKEFRGKDAVTDVLSFPQFDDFSELERFESTGASLCLGDVVICKDVAEKQAEEYGHSVKREYLYLFVHSVLHLLGYDHMEEEEKKEMRLREEEILLEIGVPRQ